MTDLHEAVEELHCWDEGKGVIFYGAKNDKSFFCSGGDLETVRKCDSSEAGFKISILMNDVARMVRQLPMVTVALVEGPAIGGGAEMLSWPDHRLATCNACVTFVQTKMGLSTGFGGGKALVNIVGYNKALDLVMSGRKLELEEGVAIGYFDNTIDETCALEECRNWMKQRVHHHTPHVIKNTKAVLRQNLTDEHKTLPSDEFESRLFAELWFGEAHRAALDANLKHK